MRRLLRRGAERVCLCGGRPVRRRPVSGTFQPSCVARAARAGRGEKAASCGCAMGQRPGGEKALHLCSPCGGKPGLLPGNGLHAGAGLPPGPCGARARRPPAGGVALWSPPAPFKKKTNWGGGLFRGRAPFSEHKPTQRRPPRGLNRAFSTRTMR